MLATYALARADAQAFLAVGETRTVALRRVAGAHALALRDSVPQAAGEAPEDRPAAGAVAVELVHDAVLAALVAVYYIHVRFPFPSFLAPLHFLLE